MRLRPLLSLTIVIALALLLPASASADFQTLYDDYRTDGVIDGCSYSSNELSSGLGEIPADVREYDPGFSDALNAALEQAAAGCGLTPQAAGGKNEVSAADGSPGPVAPKPVSFQTPTGGRGLPAVMTALIVLLGAALGAAAVLFAAHYYGWDLRSLRDRLGF
jgi:hypothetical protein